MTPTRLMIVEDHDLTRGGLVFALSAIPHYQIVAEAEDGEQAIELAMSSQPDVILMDIGLPVIDGIEATKTIKRELDSAKIIILTSHNEHSEVIAAMAVGADAYCMKNIKTERLHQVIDMVIDGALWIDPAIASIIVNQFDPQNAYLKAPHKTSTTEPLLTQREIEVLELIVEGQNNRDIAENLNVTIHTVKSHVSNIMSKLAVDDRTQAAVKALREGLV